MEAMHSWKIFLITVEKLEFNPPAGPVGCGAHPLSTHGVRAIKRDFQRCVLKAELP